MAEPRPLSTPPGGAEPHGASPLALTPEQVRVLGFIRAFRGERGYSPTVAEVAKFRGAKSVSGTQELLARMVRRGALVRAGGAGGRWARGLIPTETAGG